MRLCLNGFRVFRNQQKYTIQQNGLKSGKHEMNTIDSGILPRPENSKKSGLPQKNKPVIIPIALLEQSPSTRNIRDSQEQRRNTQNDKKLLNTKAQHDRREGH
mmetsp:Transcript_47540/g.54743  ORF Transcript_47540/g.54743 Transcript_47540/m.54743 type:complete len:103 (+) Transcript_47540:1039-1347(+)